MLFSQTSIAYTYIIFFFYQTVIIGGGGNYGLVYMHAKQWLSSILDPSVLLDIL